MPEFAPIEVPQGPLITPHIPNITGAETPKLYDAGASIVAAAAKGAEINGRVRSMESRLLAMQLDEKNKDIEHGLAVQRMAQQAGIAERNASERALIDSARIADMQFKQNWKEQTASDYSGLVEEVSKAGVKPGDSNYWPTILDIESRHSKGALTPAGRTLHNLHGSEFNKAAAAEANAAYAEDRNVKSDIKGLDWHGLMPTTAIFDNPAVWQDADWMDNTGKPVIDPVTKQPLKAKTVFLGKNQTGVDQYLTLPVDDYQRYMARWNHAQTRLSNLQEQIRDPYGQIPVFPVDSTGGGGMPPGGGTFKARSSNGRQWTMTQDQFNKAKLRDPGLTIVP
jgi:hypothetical protein